MKDISENLPGKEGKKRKNKNTALMARGVE